MTVKCVVYGVWSLVSSEQRAVCSIDCISHLESIVYCGMWSATTSKQHGSCCIGGAW